MKPAPFEYIAPNSRLHLLEVLAENGDDSKLIAGGQSLVPAMNFRLIQPTLLVDLNHIKEWEYIKKTEEGGLSIGSLTRQRQLETDPLVGQYAPLLKEIVPHIAHPQIRNRGTVGGSLAHADPASELPVLMVIRDAKIRVQNLNGERWLSAGDFFKGIFTTDLAPEEVIVEIRIPPMPKGTGWAFVEFARRKGDYALLGVAILLQLDVEGDVKDIRIVYLNAGEKPVDSIQARDILLGQKPSPDLLREAVKEAIKTELQLTANIHASKAYLQQLAQVLTRRAFNTAYARISSPLN